MKRFSITQRLFVGQQSSRDAAEVDENKGPVQINALPVPAAVGVAVSRRGLRSLINDGDRLAAPERVVGRAYAVGDWFTEGGWTYRVKTAILSASADFADDLSSVERIASCGLHVGTAFTANPGALIQIQRSDGSTPFAAHFVPSTIYPHPVQYSPPENETDPATPIADQSPEHVYLVAYLESPLSARILRVDFNPFSGTASGDRTVAQTDTILGRINGWVVKGPDNEANFLLWRGAGYPTYDPDSGSWYGRFGEAGTVIGEWKTTLTDATHSYGWPGEEAAAGHPRHSVPRFLTINATGDYCLIGDSEENIRSRPNRPRRVGPGAEWEQADLAWRLSISALPAILWPSDSTMSHARFVPDDHHWHRDSGFPHLFGLPGNQMLLCQTRRPSGGNALINVKLVDWSGAAPLKIQDTNFRVTTSFTAGTAPYYGHNAWKACLCAPMGPKRCVVARGTFGAAIIDFSTGTITEISTGGEEVVGVLANISRQEIYILTSVTDREVQLFDFNGVSKGVVYETGAYPALANAFRGAWLSADEKTLCVLTYDAGAAAESRNVISLIGVGYPAWATATDYVAGDIVLHGTPQSFHVCLIGHTSGVFATDLSANRWSAAKSAQMVVPMTAASGNDVFEGNCWAVGDPAGAIYRNVTVSGVA